MASSATPAPRTSATTSLPETAASVNIGAEKAIDIAAGQQHTCAITTGNKLLCWGNGDGGRLGYGDPNNIGDTETPAAAGPVPVGADVMQVAAGVYHTCALLAGGSVRCWGTNTNFQLGISGEPITTAYGDDEAAAMAPLVDVGGIATQIACGYFHTCALLSTGAVRCWGQNTYGQLGYPNTVAVGDNEPPSTAGDVDLGGIALEITAGQNHTCARLADGHVRCWGRGEDGRLGYGNPDNIGDNEPPSAAGNVPVH
jgi:alpha-tubulin suppressor-like RCC1 family protein